MDKGFQLLWYICMGEVQSYWIQNGALLGGPILMQSDSRPQAGQRQVEPMAHSRFEGLPKNKLFILKNNNHSRSVGGRGRWLPPPSNFVVELILYNHH